MMASLFSGYSVSGIVNEAYNTGWMATRWIPGGVGLYIAFAVMAPRLHALSKRRGYFTISEVLFDRYSCPSSSHPLVAHAIHLITFFCLQLPVFTYLITQFQAVGREVRTFTYGEITATTAICVGAAVLLLCDLLGGMRAVAYTDVLQGVVLFFGSIVFLIIQRTELGGLARAYSYWSNPGNAARASVRAMQYVPAKVNIVAYFDFVFKTTVAATMFPHLTARLFAAQNAKVIQRGMACMVFTFFVVQFSSMVTGWVAIDTLRSLPRGASAFGELLKVVAERGGGQAFASALLLASAICAMMSTADSALLACSSMWVRDIYTKYFRRNASQAEQILFGKFIAFAALSIGVALGIITVERGKPDLSSLFSLQNVTPIHVTPAVWLGLHWRGLRGEAVLIGICCGLPVTLGFVFSDQNIQRAIGNDLTKTGLSGAWLGFVVNMGVTIILGVLMQHFPRLFGLKALPPPPEEYESDSDSPSASESSGSETDAGRNQLALKDEAAVAAAKGIDLPTAASDAETAFPEGQQQQQNQHQGGLDQAVALATALATATAPRVEGAYRPHVARYLDIGGHRDRILNPFWFALMGLVLLFTVPFYRVPMSWDGYVGNIGAWAFTSLFLSGILAIMGAITFMFLWENYRPPREQLVDGVQQVVVAAEQQGTVAVATDAAPAMRA